ncbi:MAG TPA: hypothetical protein VGZ90_13620 [Puia sp.]|jgi:hypothetical protein|nr:hypothetical protein [Puia sp.]
MKYERVIVPVKKEDIRIPWHCDGYSYYNDFDNVYVLTREQLRDLLLEAYNHNRREYDGRATFIGKILNRC